MSFKIEKNVPLYPRRGKPWRRKYPWWEMEPGDSFLVPKDKGASAQGSGINFCRRHRKNCRIERRTEGDFVRFWLLLKKTEEEDGEH
jgi:hypothetical protein